MNETAPEYPIDKIAALLTSGLGLETIRQACTEKLFIDPAEVDAAIAAATARLGLAADYDPILEKGRAITRLEDLYNRAIRVQDIKTALAAEKARAHLLGLAAVEPPESRTAGDGEADQECLADHGETPRRPAGSISEAHEAIDLHLEPLSPPLTDNPDATYADLIRLAAEEIVQLRKTVAGSRSPVAGKRQTAKKTKGRNKGPKQRTRRLSARCRNIRKL